MLPLECRPNPEMLSPIWPMADAMAEPSLSMGERFRERQLSNSNACVPAAFADRVESLRAASDAAPVRTGFCGSSKEAR